MKMMPQTGNVSSVLESSSDFGGSGAIDNNFIFDQIYVRKFPFIEGSQRKKRKQFFVELDLVYRNLRVRMLFFEVSAPIELMS